MGDPKKTSDATKTPQEPASTGKHFDVSLPEYSWSRRTQIPLIAGAAIGLIRTLGPTLRYEILGWQNAERVYASHRRCIWTFWHCAIFGVLWWRRGHGVVVMNSTNFDGQWTRRLIENLGYGTAQGSSTRGGLRGLAVMAQRLEEGLDVAFTIDGPRGPRFVAKPGPAMLARRTGCPIMEFHVAYEHFRTFESTWDHFQMPRPFTRVVMAFAPPVEVPSYAGRELLEEKHAEMQKSLERARDFANSWFSLSPQEKEKQRTVWNA
jgi:lysophospholipid acyltransferase (LPLAT)-like uncharacterized protein